MPITPFAYAFLAGSRIRVTITAPGGDRPEWALGNTYQTHSTVTDTLALGRVHGVRPTALVLSVLPGVTSPGAQPPCPSLRGQPSRTSCPPATAADESPPHGRCRHGHAHTGDDVHPPSHRSATLR